MQLRPAGERPQGEGGGEGGARRAARELAAEVVGLMGALQPGGIPISVQSPFCTAGAKGCRQRNYGRNAAASLPPPGPLSELHQDPPSCDCAMQSGSRAAAQSARPGPGAWCVPGLCLLLLACYPLAVEPGTRIGGSGGSCLQAWQCSPRRRSERQRTRPSRRRSSSRWRSRSQAQQRGQQSRPGAASH